MKRCTLCGGKLDSTKRCTLCGLDNTKNDDMYRYMVNRNTCEDMPLTHVHEEPAKATPKKVVNKPSYAPTYQVNKTPVKKPAMKKTSTPVKPKGCLASIATLIPIIIAVIGILSSIFENVGTPEPDFSVVYEELEVLPEGWEEGDYYSTVLGEGSYLVGYDIPAGFYEIEMAFDYEGYLDIYDEEGNIEFSEYIEEDYIYEVLLCDEYQLVVGENIVLSFSTNNAQTLLIE